MAKTNNLLPKAIKGHDIPPARPNSWEPMELPEQFIDSIDTTGGDLDDAAKFNLLVSSVPSPWARVLLTQHAIATKIDPTDDRTLSQFYSYLCSEWRGLLAAFVLYPEDFELTKPIELVAKDFAKRSGKFDIISTYAKMLFENEALWKHNKGDNETPKIQILYYKNGDRRFPVGGTSPFSILFPGMNYKLAADEQRIYWTPDGKFEDPANRKFETYYKKGEAKYNDKHFNNLKKLYSFLSGVQKNTVKYIDTLEGIWKNHHKNDSGLSTTDDRYNIVQKVLNAAISSWMKELETILGPAAEKSKNIPVNNERPIGPLGELLNIKTTYYWHGNAFHTQPETDSNGNIVDTIINNVEELFIDSNYLALWRDFSSPVNDPSGRPTNKKEHDYTMSPVYFLTAEEDGQKWFLAMPLSEKAMNDVLKNELESIIKGKNENVKIEAQKHGNRVEVYLKARINAEGDWINVRNRSFNVEIPDQNKKVFAWPNFSSEKWERYYYYSEFPANSVKDVQMIPVFDGMVDIEDSNKTNDWAKDAFLKMVSFPADATSDDHTYEIIRTNKPLKRIKIRKRIGNNVFDLGWLVIRKANSVNPDDPQAMQIISDKELAGVDVGFDFGSTNSCAYYSGRGSKDINPVPFSNRRLAIIGFDNKPVETAEKNELLFISNEEPINKNGQIKSWLHEHDHRFIDSSMMSEELIGGVPVNETNIKVMDMDRYDITTNAGKLHYNMKWLGDAKGIQRKQAFIKMVWIHICADLFAEGLYPKTLNWSYPSAMSASESGLENIFNNIPAPCPDHIVTDKISYTEAEAVCSYFLGKNIALEKDRLFVGIDIGGSTSDILVLGRDSGKKANPATGKSDPDTTKNTSASAAVNYDDLSRKELCDLVRQRGLSGKIDVEEVSRKELVDFLNANDAASHVDYDELGRKELCELVRQRGLSGKIDVEEVSRKELVDFLKANESIVDYDELSRKELADMACQRGLGSLAALDELSRSELVDILKSNKRQSSPESNSEEESSETTDRRLYTQCSVRMAAGVFFDAIINSRKFRDCIRTFHASRQTKIRVEDIDTIDKEPSRAPYYLNNIFDQLHGDSEFKTFYSYLKANVPFVFTLPAYILGALMTYTGMLVRNAILAHELSDIDEVHLRYFGKGGRLFEWLFFTIQPDMVSQYLDACFAVGLKNELINEHFGRKPNERIIHCIFDNVKDSNYGKNEHAENKSEVARGLVSRQNIKDIVANSKNIYDTSAQKNSDEYDARKQEVLGEVGFTRKGKLLDDLAHVDDNFYKYEGEISTPKKFENFEEFMKVFFTFVSRVTHVYDSTNKLGERIKDVYNVRSFINRDPEFIKYLDNIRAGNDGYYRMPIFIASALFFLEEVLLTEVFSNS